MIKVVKNISSIKEQIKSYINEDVNVKVNLGRNKFVSYTGKVTNIYPALFTVLPYGDYDGKTSFSYSEVMCGAVSVKKQG